ncbi:YeeE/YedE family protein [Sphingomonas sp.]|uniref:YeeE/YedE family protein n=1 Tax=Sphingomonas sp. TaxID=28214 RepID=UPI00345B7CD9
MIGLAAAIMLLGLGRIAGVSGLAARAVGIAPPGAPWVIAVAFIVGLPLGGALVGTGGFASAIHMPASLLTLIVAGLLVGIGTRLGSGCTSGHGVCGLSRLSRRSMLATLTFMAAGIATVAAMRGLAG